MLEAGESRSNPYDEDRARECGALNDRLRNLATRRALLDGEEARALRDAERLDVHEQFGFGSLLSYLEHVFGYTPRVALDRLRVARALEALPLVTEALDTNALCYTAVRELTRVATATTEQAWLDAARDKPVGVIANLVAGHKQGDAPTDAPDAAIVERPYNLDLLPEVVGRLREVRADMDHEVGRRVTDSELVIALCEAWLSSEPCLEADEIDRDRDQDATAAEGSDASSDAATVGLDDLAVVLGKSAIEYGLDQMAEAGRNRRPSLDNGRARYQVAISLCPACSRGHQDGGGLALPVRPATLARAECDAQRIGSLDDHVPGRATQDISPVTRRFVFRRDHGRCQVPGCRAHRHLEVHHVVPRAAGGSNDISNLVLLCGGCHTRVHEGTLTLSGLVGGLGVVRYERFAESRGEMRG